MFTFYHEGHPSASQTHDVDKPHVEHNGTWGQEISSSSPGLEEVGLYMAEGHNRPVRPSPGGTMI